MREVGVEGRWRPLGRGRVGDAVSGGRRRHEGAPEGWSAGGPSPPETGAAPLRKTRFWGKNEEKIFATEAPPAVVELLEGACATVKQEYPQFETSRPRSLAPSRRLEHNSCSLLRS